MIGGNSSRWTIRNFCYPDGSKRSPMLMYASPLNVIEESLLGDVSRVSNNDLLRSMLINEGVSGSLQTYYELVRENDLSARAELLVHRKRLCEYR